MGNTEFQKDLEKAIEATFDELRKLYNKLDERTTRLVFPTYIHGTNQDTPRISEQEFRFVFVEKIQCVLKKYEYFYSIETPTENKYRFSDKKEQIQPKIDVSGQSAAFDLTIKRADGTNVALIEFKAHSADKHEIAKDFCKLLNENENAEYRYFINLFEKVNSNTINALFDKMKSKPDSKQWLPSESYFSQSVNVVVGVLTGKGPRYKKNIVTIDGLQND